MSGEPETLTLTLEEAIVLLAERGCYLTREGRLWTIVGGHSDMEGSTEWDEEMSNFFDRPVVARDDAAELRAALELLLEKVVGTPSIHGLIDLTEGEFTDTPLGTAEAIANARAALAATEGSE